MNDMLENNMLNETAPEPQEQDPDEALDFQRADELRAALVNITRSHIATSRITKWLKELGE